MGRIKTRQIKAKTHELYEKYSDEFTAEFSQNKVVVDSKMNQMPKKLRNIMAGYATRMKKAE